VAGAGVVSSVEGVVTVVSVAGFCSQAATMKLAARRGMIRYLFMVWFGLSATPQLRPRAAI
jgi:hypothetical protein